MVHPLEDKAVWAILYSGLTCSCQARARERDMRDATDKWLASRVHTWGAGVSRHYIRVFEHPRAGSSIGWFQSGGFHLTSAIREATKPLLHRVFLIVGDLRDGLYQHPAIWAVADDFPPVLQQKESDNIWAKGGAMSRALPIPHSWHTRLTSMYTLSLLVHL